MLVGQGGAEDAATDGSVLLTMLDGEEAEVEVATQVDDQTVALPGPYDTGTEDHMPPDNVCKDELGAA